MEGISGYFVERWAERSQRPRRVMAGGEVWVLILPFTQLCSLVPSVMISLYSPTVSQAVTTTVTRRGLPTAGVTVGGRWSL
jgi:hypothetical protein